MDVFEGNLAALQTTVHTEATTEWNADGTCNRAGCYVNWGNHEQTASGQRAQHLFGLDAHGGIDTSEPFDVAASVTQEGALSVALSQRGRTLPFFNSSIAGNAPPNTAPSGVPPVAKAASSKAWAEGMYMVASLWGSKELSGWLDGTCDDDMRT